jgi:hypothetical protein
MNVSVDGFLCFDMFTQRYQPTTTIVNLLKGAQAVLAKPDRRNAVQTEKQWNFQSAKADYERNARASAAGGFSNIDFVTRLCVEGEPGFAIADDGNPAPPPRVFADKVSGLKIDGTWTVGSWFDDDTI